jgi:hypothetical protein
MVIKRKFNFFQYLGKMPRYFFVLYLLLLIPTCWTIVVSKDILYGLYLLVLYVSVCFGINEWSKLHLAFKFVVFTVICSFLTEVSGTYCGYFYQNNMPVYHLGLPLLFISTTLVFTGVFQSKKFKFWFMIPCLIAGSSFLLALSYFEGLSEMPRFGLLFFSFSTIVFSLFALRKIAFAHIKTQLTTNPFFWFIFGSLFFYFLTFFIFAFWLISNYQPEWLLILMKLSNIVLYTSYMISIRLASKQP